MRGDDRGIIVPIPQRPLQARHAPHHVVVVITVTGNVAERVVDESIVTWRYAFLTGWGAFVGHGCKRIIGVELSIEKVGRQRYVVGIVGRAVLDLRWRAMCCDIVLEIARIQVGRRPGIRIEAGAGIDAETALVWLIVKIERLILFAVDISTIVFLYRQGTARPKRLGKPDIFCGEVYVCNSAIDGAGAARWIAPIEIEATDRGKILRIKRKSALADADSVI